MTQRTVICLDGDVEGAVNLRDLGGYRAAGGRVRAGLVYRSGMMHTLSAAGLRALRERLGVGAVVDLRSEEELARDGVAAFAEVDITHHHAPVYARTDITEEARREQWRQMRTGAYDWSASYQRMAEQGGGAFRRLFTLLAEDAGVPLVFHCTAGRDRTGVAAALLLGSLGVDEAAIAHDYALTGGFLRPHTARFFRPETERRITDEEMAGILATSEAAMRGFLAWLTARHGSVAGYLVEHAGLSLDTLAATRDRLIARE